MEITTIEEVTRIYCDICNKNITGSNRIGAGLDKPGQGWVTCDGGMYVTKEGRRDLDGAVQPGVLLSCADIAVLKYKYPDILTARK